VGIGAGPGCDGQVLVYSDLLGSLAHPHHASHVPRFCRVFAEVGKESRRGLAAFRDAVRTGAFPSDEYSPYAMSDAEAARFAASLARDADRRREDSDEVRRRHIADDEYEIAKLY
jgi:3-methyl-2-oxobutanoate hydroxymethyltransferase